MDRGHTRGPIGLMLALGVTAGALAGCSTTGAQGSPATSPTGASVTVTDTSSPTGSPAGSSTGAPGPTDTGSASATPSVSPSPSTSPSTSPSPSPSGPADGMLRPGASGPQVLAVQQRLVALGYWIGTPDGRYGDVTAQAVTALQKAAGLGRDGVLGPRTRAALDSGVRPSARSRSGHVVEIDKQRQLLLIVDDGTVSRVLNASTGSGQYYTAPDGHVGHAVTPAGKYSVFRSVDGWDTSPLGHLYRPRYFNGGIAVHGYTSVPSFAASHGCVRVSLPAMDMIWRENLLPRKAAVWVY